MNIELTTELALSFTAMLAAVAITGAGLAGLSSPVRTVIIRHEAAVPIGMILAAKVGSAAIIRAKIKTVFMPVGSEITALHCLDRTTISARDFYPAICRTASHATEDELLFKLQRIGAQATSTMNTPGVGGRAKIGNTTLPRTETKAAFAGLQFSLSCYFASAAIGACNLYLTVGHTASHTAKKELRFSQTQRIDTEAESTMSAPDIRRDSLFALTPFLIAFWTAKRVVRSGEFALILFKRDSTLFTYNLIWSTLPPVAFVSSSVLCCPLAITSLITEVMDIISQAIGSTLKWLTAVVTRYGCSVPPHSKSLLPHFDSRRSCLGNAYGRRPGIDYTITALTAKRCSLDIVQYNRLSRFVKVG